MSAEVVPVPKIGTGRCLLLVRSGNTLYVTPDGQKACPPDVFALLHPELTYDQRRFLYGYESYDPTTGDRRRVEVTERRLYGQDSRGRLFTNFGFLSRVHKTLKEAGFVLAYHDRNAELEKTKPHPRPLRYVPDWGNVAYHFKYRARQEECLQRIAASPHGLVHAVTGFGKMAVIAMVCLLYPKARIHVVTRRRPIVNKIVEYLTRYIPNVGQYGAGSRFEGDRVTVFTTKSLKYSNFDADILLADEAHEVVSKEASPVLARYHFSRNFALTATPVGRGDGSDPRLEALFGPRIFYLPYWEAVSLGLVVPMQVRWYDVILSSNPADGYEDVEKRRHGIWHNAPRNDIIARAFLAQPPDEQKLVLAETVYQAVEIYRRVRHAGVTLVYDQLDAQRFDGYKISGDLPPDLPRMTPSVKEAHRRRLESGEGHYVATPTWAVGIDPIHLQHLFMAAPWQSEILVQQAPGRASRINGVGKECGIVHDLRDQFDPGFRRAARTREGIYGDLRWDQEVVPCPVTVPPAEGGF